MKIIIESHNNGIFPGLVVNVNDIEQKDIYLLNDILKLVEKIEKDNLEKA